ncbi:MAG: CoA transferase, partial [Acidobacteria bacterium]|nr:CoA transferase [Acidobacteriota bacterium]
LASEQARLNGYLMDLDHPVVGRMTVTGCPIALNGETTHQAKPVAEHGQHTEEILLEAGYTWEEISTLRDAEVV